MIAYLIDDDTSAVDSAKRFTTKNLEFEFLEPAPLEALAAKVFNAKPGIVVLDYRLDERAGTTGQPAKYKASALAQQLRDLAGDGGTTDFPIVLHSAEDKIRQQYHPEKTAHDLFDDVIKKEARKDDGDVGRRLDSLADGYARLVTLRPYKDNLLTIFGLKEEQGYLIDHQEIRGLAGSTHIPHVMARFILNRLIKRNNILVNEKTVLARCGIDARDMGKEIIFRELERGGGMYSGVFSRFRPSWWRLPTDEIIESWLEAPLAGLTARERTLRLSKRFGYDFLPAVSTWNNSPDERFTQICSLCESPTLVGQSVAVYEHTSGVLTERRRICFDCIQLDRHLNGQDIPIDDLDRHTEAAVRAGNIERN